MIVLAGVDISAYQSSIPAGQDFVILKATEGTTYIDSHFAGWWAELAGELRGAYHFAHPNNSAVAEADHFLAVVQPHLADGDLLILDFEWNGGQSPAACSRWAQTWLARVRQKTGRVPLVYTFLSFAENCAGLGGYPLWIADPSSAKGKPRVPAPWKTWVMHQYSTIGGIDHDVFNGNAAAFRALGSQTPHPPLEEDVYGGKLETGTGALTVITCPAGKLGAIGFGCDNGLQQLPPAEIRVAMHSVTGGWSQIKNPLVVDSSKGKAVVVFTAHDVDEISVQRLDDGAVVVGWDAS